MKRELKVERRTLSYVELSDTESHEERIESYASYLNSHVCNVLESHEERIESGYRDHLWLGPEGAESHEERIESRTSAPSPRT